MCKLKGIVVWLPTIISLIGLLGGMYVAGKMVLAEAKVVGATTAILRPLTEKEILQLYLFEAVKYDVQKYNLLKRIITCESRWDIMAYNEKSGDYGLFQINEKWWDKKAKELGFENYKDNWKENIQLGIWIYENYGKKPWNWSRMCWK